MRNLIPLFIVIISIELGYGQCLPPSASGLLDVNSVEATIANDGTLFSNYKVPVSTGIEAWYSTGLWIGGLDANGQLHVAAKGEEPGNDFYAGHLDPNGTIGSATCDDSDRIFKLNRHEVDQFRFLFDAAGYSIPTDILEWPATGNPYAEFEGDAPFVDVNFDGVYNPDHGDYPAFNFDGTTDMDYDLLGDQCLWYVINDAGNTHTAYAGQPMNVTIQCMAYAFGTCTELDYQTFYRYSIKNESGVGYHDVRLGLFGDPDLGDHEDDYIGCEVMRSIGYCQNGDMLDGIDGTQPGAYSANPPATGIDILQGPIAIPGDSVDNDRDGVIDENGEHLVMSKFTRFFDFGYAQLPATSADVYSYLSGHWLDGMVWSYGGSGHPVGASDPNAPTCFLYPGDSDPQGFGTGMNPQPAWTEQTSNNPIGDRKIMIGVGPFNLENAKTEYLHFATLYAKDDSGSDPYHSVEMMFDVSDSVQYRFDNGFEGMPCCPPTAMISLDESQPGSYFFSPLSSGNSYLWTFGDGTSSTEPFPLHYYDQPGDYQVCLIVSNDCGSDTICQNITITVASIVDEETEELILFPNPASGSFTVTHPGLLAVTVYAMDGKLVWEETATGPSLTVDSNLAMGVYAIKALTEHGELVKRLVVR